VVFTGEQSVDHHIGSMSSSSNNVTAPSAEEATLLRLLTELEKAVRTNAARCTPKVAASLCDRLRKLAAEISSEAPSVWHP